MENCKIQEFAYPKVIFKPQQQLSIGHPFRTSAFTRVKPVASSNLCLGHLTISDLSLLIKQEIDLRLIGQEYINSAPNYNVGEESIQNPQDGHTTPEFGATKIVGIPNYTISSEDTTSSSVPEFVRNLEAPKVRRNSHKVSSAKTNGDTSSSASKASDVGKEELSSDDITDASQIASPFGTNTRFTTDDQPKRVGFYTVKERQEKIRKYKEKILRWKRGEHKNKDRYIKRRVIAKNKPRVGGKFVKMT